MLYIGDCRDSLRQLAVEGVKAQTCVTSPPYWGLRDYGVDGQLGLEATPEAFVATMVEVFRLVREVLADDGTCWVNLGDSYGSGTRASRDYSKTTKHGYWNNEAINKRIPSPAKQLLGIPWRVALALQADGWYLRQDIIWAKPNPMPESVTDRCTKSHEYLFLLTKQARYYFDAEAIAEPSNHTDWPMMGRATHQARREKIAGGELQPMETRPARNRRSVWTIATQPYSAAHFATFPESLVKPCILAGSRPGDLVLDPFLGSGTVAKVAQDLGRQWVGCELNPEYAKLIEERTRQQGLTLMEAP